MAGSPGGPSSFSRPRTQNSALSSNLARGSLSSLVISATIPGSLKLRVSSLAVSRLQAEPSQYSHVRAGPFTSPRCSITLRNTPIWPPGGCLSNPKYSAGVTSAVRS